MTEICTICMEPTTWLCPCDCEMPIHKGCLFKMHARGYHHCTICKKYLPTAEYLLMAFAIFLNLVIRGII